jgi:hypothetical protein
VPSPRLKKKNLSKSKWDSKTKIKKKKGGTESEARHRPRQQLLQKTVIGLTGRLQVNVHSRWIFLARSNNLIFWL